MTDDSHNHIRELKYSWQTEIWDYVAKNLLTFLLKFSGLWSRGIRNALDLREKPVDIHFSNLPQSFDGLRILFLSDLHLGRSPELVTRITDVVQQLKFDLCLFGGDYRFHFSDSMDPCLEDLKTIVTYIDAPLGIYGVLGNHEFVKYG